jgi:hypothetical protein
LTNEWQTFPTDKQKLRFKFKLPDKKWLR